MTAVTIALVGDRDDNITAHRAIPLALKIAEDQTSARVNIEWVDSESITDDISGIFSHFAGIWCVPASPYKNKLGALEAIRFARENRVPFLGTCGGYQHAALEFARNVLGHADADNIEDNPATTFPLIASLLCALQDGKSDHINLIPGSRIARIYASTRIDEKYNCGYGLNREYLPLFENSDLCIVGHDQDGDPRAIEIPGHPFFTGVAFQPERSALEEKSHPLISAFVDAVIEHAQ